MKALKTTTKGGTLLAMFFLLTVFLTLLPADAQAAANPNLSKKKITISAGTKKQLKVIHRNGRKVTWKSSNKKVATVTKSGKVKAKTAGKAVITAKVGGKKLKCRVTVEAIFDKKSIMMEKGKYASLKLNGVKQTVTWGSSDNSVVSVTKAGKYKVWLSAKKIGTATITAKVSGKIYYCKVKVKKRSRDSYYTEDGFTTYYELRKSKAIVKKVLGNNPKKYSVLERCCKLALWECKYMTYDYNSKAGEGQTAEQAYRTKGTGVCAGYADLYYCLLKAAGVENVKVHNTKTRHAWNMVRVNGKWYNCDITNMDRKRGSASIDVRYFMKSDSAFYYKPSRKKKYKNYSYSETVFLSGYSLNPPYCTSTKYDNNKRLTLLKKL